MTKQQFIKRVEEITGFKYSPNCNRAYTFSKGRTLLFIYKNETYFYKSGSISPFPNRLHVPLGNLINEFYNIKLCYNNNPKCIDRSCGVCKIEYGPSIIRL